MSYYLLTTPLIAFGMCLVLVALVLLRNHRSNVHRLFSLFLFGMALWGLFTFGLRSSPTPESALLWDKGLMLIVVFCSVFFLHFSFLRSRVKPRRFLLPGAYLLLLALISVSPTNLVVKEVGIDPYGYFPITGPLFYLVALSSYGFFILGLINFRKGYRASSSYEERNSYLYVIAGVGCFLLGGIVDLLSIFGMPVPPVALVGNILFCLLSSIALLRYHLLDIRIVLRKGTTYLLVSILVALPYAGVILLVNRVLVTRPLSPWVYFLFLLLLAAVLQPLWRWAQRVVDKLFYRERYDYLRALADFSRETHDISDLGQLGSSLVKLIGRALQTSSVHLLLLSESGDFIVRSSAGENAAQLTLNKHSPLLRWLRSNKNPLYHRDLDIIPQLQSLTARKMNELKKMHAELFVPIITREEELVGILILGKKLSEQPYSEEDERLVLAVAGRMAIELENARLYTLEIMMRRELQRQDEQKTEFLHSVAHELKTPLTAIVSSSEVLSEEASIAPSLRKKLINNIRQSAWSMDKKVAGLLDLAQTQIGGLRIEPEPLEIGHVTTEVASQLHILFQKKEQTLTLEIPDSLPKVNVDRGNLEQVLFNLLSNANKFSPTGSNIILRVREVDRRIIVEVEDSAPVVSEEEKKKLFDPYYRGEGTHRRERIPGLGLGLAISKKLVDLHGGEIWVESKPGKGNTFAFSLPVLAQRTNGIK